MRLLFKMFRKVIVLGFAAFGAYKAWELCSEYSARARDGVLRAKATVGSAAREAEGDVKDASRDAAGSVIDASRLAVAEVADAVADAALGSSGAPVASQG